MGCTREVYWKALRRKILLQPVFKITNKGKPPRMFSLACNLTKNDVKFPPVKISSKKVRANNVGSYTIKITSKKSTWKWRDFWIIEITSKKVCGNGVDFWIIEITSKKYAEMTWKFVEIWYWTYRRNIHVKSTSIRRSVSVGT